MHRSLKRIVAPFFLLLFFAGRGTADTLTFTFNQSVVGGSDTWTMQQDAVPDFGSVASGAFTFSMVPVFESFSNRTKTFDLTFFLLSPPLTTNLRMDCDPFGIFPDDLSRTCDYFNWLQLDGNVRMWKRGPHDSVAFIPGTYGGLDIKLNRDRPHTSALATVSTPEPCTLALLLMSFATLFLVAVGLRPSHR